MQVVETLVIRANGELTVEFTGEGGDVINVHFANAGEPAGDAEAIEKARAVMVQVATFEESAGADEVDAASPDEIDPVYDIGRRDVPGAEVTCVLEYMEAGQINRTEQVTLPSMEATAAEVERSAIHVVESFGTPDDLQGWAVRAVDADGNVLALITFEQARDLAAARSAAGPL
jgi:hypothetical protein